MRLTQKKYRRMKNLPSWFTFSKRRRTLAIVIGLCKVPDDEARAHATCHKALNFAFYISLTSLAKYKQVEGGNTFLVLLLSFKKNRSAMRTCVGFQAKKRR